MRQSALALCLLILTSASLTRADDLRVMSFNIRYGAAKDGNNSWSFRRELLFKTIEDFHPDLLGLQEVLPFQRDELRQRLKNYDFLGVPRDDGKFKGEIAAVFFLRDRFEKLSDGHFWLSPTPEVPSKGWDADLPRIVTWTQLRDRNSQRPLFFFNTHFDHKGVKTRLESAKLLRQRITTIATENPVIATGDFNSTDESEPYGLMIRFHIFGEDPLHLVDTYREIYPVPRRDDFTAHPFTGKSAHRNRIDWILRTDDFRTLAADIDRAHDDTGRYPSDHFPVTAILDWRSTPTTSAATTRPVRTTESLPSR